MADGDKIRLRQGLKSNLNSTSIDPGQLLFATYEDEVQTSFNTTENLTQGDIYFDRDSTHRIKIANDVDKARTLFAGQTSSNTDAGQFSAIIEGISKVYDGLTIVVKLNSNPSELYNTLNINNLGNKLIWFKEGQTATYDQLRKGQELILVYRTNIGSYTVPSSGNTGALANGTNVRDGWVISGLNLDTINSLTNSGTIITDLASSAAATYTSGGNISPGVTGILPVVSGGTGVNTLPDGALLQGNATSAIIKATTKGSVSLPIYIDTNGVPQTITSYSGNAASATKLKTTRKIGISGGITGTATNFNGTANITIPVTALNFNAENFAISGVLSRNVGGTGNSDALEQYHLVWAETDSKMYTTPYAYIDYTAGTTSTQGEEKLVLGNSLINGTDKNARGYLALYSSGAYGGRIYSAEVTDSWKDHVLPATAGWLVTAGNGSSTGAGSANVPIYVNTSGIATSVSANTAKVNLASESADSVYKAAPSFGITGTLPVSHGGTGDGGGFTKNAILVGNSASPILSSALYIENQILETGRYFHNVVEFQCTNTPKEILIKTKFPFTNGTQMPKIFIHMYNYSGSKPTEITLGYYIYDGAFCNYGATSNTSLRPTITLSTYTENSKKYVAIGIGLIGSVELATGYFTRFNVDVLDLFQGRVNGELNRVKDWVVTSNTTTTTIVPTDDRKSLDYIDQSQTAKALSTAGTIKINLTSDNAVTYTNGGNITPGVNGTLPVTHGGTGHAGALTTNKLIYSSSTTEMSESSIVVTGSGTKLDVTGASGASGEYRAARGSYAMWMGFGSGNKNHGLYSETKGDWIVYSDENGAVTLNGNAATATKASQLTTGRTFKVNLESESASSKFNGTANITDIGVAGKLPVTHGGTGTNLLTSGALLIGNGVSPISAAPGTGSATVPIYIDSNGLPQPVTGYSGTATTAAALSPGANIGLSGIVTGTATLFTGANDITIPVTDLYLSGTGVNLHGILPVAAGGTGQNSALTKNALIYANDTTSMASTSKIRTDGTNIYPSSATISDNGGIGTSTYWWKEAYINTYNNSMKMDSIKAWAKTGPYDAGWTRVCTLTGLHGYGIGTVYINGSWSSEESTMAAFEISFSNTSYAHIKQTLGGRLTTPDKIRLVYSGTGGKWYLDIHIPARTVSSATGDRYVTIVGLLTVSEKDTTTNYVEETPSTRTLVRDIIITDDQPTITVKLNSDTIGNFTGANMETGISGILPTVHGGTGSNSSHTTGRVIYAKSASELADTKYMHLNYNAGTTSATGYEELVIGNNIKTGTTDNAFGRLAIYSSGNTGAYLTAAAVDSGWNNHVLPVTEGWLVVAGNGSSTGAGNNIKPVYVSTAGVATAVDDNSVLVNLASDSGASIYATNPEIGVKGILPTTHGGTGHTGSFTANRLVYSSNETTLDSASNIYASTSAIAVNKTSITSGYNFEVSGKSLFGGVTQVNNTTDSTTHGSSANGSLIVKGGAYIAKTLRTDGDIVLYTGNNDRSIIFGYSTTTSGTTIPEASWRLLSNGSGTGDNNYFKLQASPCAGNAGSGNWNDVIKFTINSFNAHFAGNVSPIEDNIKTLGTANYRWANLYTYDATVSHNQSIGGTLTILGQTTLQAKQYSDTKDTGALNLQDSDIYGVNSIKFADESGTAAEGLQWFRSDTTVDSLWVKDGVIYFTPDRTWGSTATDYTVLTSGNVSWTAWEGGTTAGPKPKLTVGGTTIIGSAIPSASSSASGVITIDPQTFAGKKTFQGGIESGSTILATSTISTNSSTDSTHSKDTSASIVTKGGVSVEKTLSAKVVRIDNNQTTKGVSLQFNETLETLNFVFAS